MKINLLHGDALAVADQAFLFKMAAKEVALKHGLNAVFMAKPLSGEAGSSMHLHQSIVDAEGRNIFSAADGSATPAFSHYLGGLQAYGPDLMLVYAPFVNSYRRYVTGSQAPINLDWGPRQPHHRPAHPLERPRGPACRKPHRRQRPTPTPTWPLLPHWPLDWPACKSNCHQRAIEGNGYDHAPHFGAQLSDGPRPTGTQRTRFPGFWGPTLCALTSPSSTWSTDSYLREISAWGASVFVAAGVRRAALADANGLWPRPVEASAAVGPG